MEGLYNELRQAIKERFDVKTAEEASRSFDLHSAHGRLEITIISNYPVLADGNRITIDYDKYGYPIEPQLLKTTYTLTRQIFIALCL